MLCVDPFPLTGWQSFTRTRDSSLLLTAIDLYQESFIHYSVSVASLARQQVNRTGSAALTLHI